MKYISLAAFFVLSASSIAIAAERKSLEIYVPGRTGTVSVKVIEGRLDETQDLTILGFAVEKAKINSIKKELGNVETKVTGDGVLSNTSICYLGLGDENIQFNSGEMGGGSLVTSIEVSSHHPNSASCKSSKKITQHASSQRGIRLKMSQSAVIKLLGEPSYTSSTELIYFYQKENKNTDPKCATSTVTGSIFLTFKDGELIDFKISQAESC